MSTTQRPLGCHDVELSLGVLVLGAIDPAERPAVEAHLATCPRCTATLTELAPLPGLLHRLDAAAAAAPAPALEPPPELRQRLVAAARDEWTRRARRRRLVAVTAAAAALVGAVLAVSVPRALDDGGPAAPSLVASATDPRTDVRADLRLVPGDTGSELTLRLSGVAPGQRCQLVAIDSQGRRDVAATWVASYAGRASVTGHTGFSPDRIRRLVVVTTTGRTLVRVPVHAPA